MSVAGLGLVSRGATSTFRSPLAHRARHIPVQSRCRLCVRSPLSEASALPETLPAVVLLRKDHDPPPYDGTDQKYIDGPMWRKISSKKLGISHSMITKPTRIVLNGLKKKGYQVYLVGGCVRDLILKRTPKDFDIITSANLYEVMKTFSHCQIIGRRFPICHVHVNDSIVEVSSFKTSARNSSQDWTYLFRKPHDCGDLDYMRWSNCLRRDFTINGLMFDPYLNMIYDYAGGFEDIKKAKVQTVIPARISFQEDSARILRAIRIAARLNFRLTRETALSIRNLSCSILRLDKARLLMEMNYMLAYGSAEASLRILWKLGLLEILLPIQAAYFISQGFRRRDNRSNMLLSLFSNLDKLLAPDKPCNCCLWAALFVFHQALVYKPRDPLVISSFILAVRNGGDLSEVIPVARKIPYQHDSRFSELKPEEFKKDRKLAAEILDLANSMKIALITMTDETQISRALAGHPQAPDSNLVLISFQVYQKICDLIECLTSKRERDFIPKRESGIDYKDLVRGDLAQLRHVFARVIFDTIYPPNLEDSKCNETP